MRSALKFKMATKSGGKVIFCEKSPVDSADTLRVQNFVEITLSHTVSKINSLLRFTQKFKMATKSGGKAIFCENSQVDSADTLWVQNFVEIALSRTISEINALLHFTQKFKMAANLCFCISGKNSKI